MKFLKLTGMTLFLFGSCLIVLFAQLKPIDDNGVKFSFELKDNSSEESKTIFNVGEKILIKTWLENYSNEPFPFYTTDEMYQYRFELTRIGEQEKIGYRKDKASMLSDREKEAGTGKRLALDPILPGNTQELETLNLDDRFENLQPGNYKLTINYRSGKLIHSDKAGFRALVLSSEVTFEIVP